MKQSILPEIGLVVMLLDPRHLKWKPRSVPHLSQFPFPSEERTPGRGGRGRGWLKSQRELRNRAKRPAMNRTGTVFVECGKMGGSPVAFVARKTVLRPLGIVGDE